MGNEVAQLVEVFANPDIHMMDRRREIASSSHPPTATHLHVVLILCLPNQINKQINIIKNQRSSIQPIMILGF